MTEQSPLLPGTRALGVTSGEWWAFLIITGVSLIVVVVIIAMVVKRNTAMAMKVLPLAAGPAGLPMAIGGMIK